MSSQNITKEQKKIISIIDYGISNLGSIRNMLRKIGVGSEVISRPEEVLNARKIILPGVGAFDNGVEALNKLGLIDPIKEVAKKNIPILGICLGMQLLGNKSEEGILEGIGLIPGTSIKFNFKELDRKFRIPHMGWNYILPSKKNPLLTGLDQKSRFYFVHSFHFIPNDNDHVLANTSYGFNFVSIVSKKNIYGTQFHPEKSHKYGIQLLTSFSKI